MYLTNTAISSRVSEFNLVEFKGKKLAITVCEDIWDIEDINPLYRIKPVVELARQQPDVLINLSASPFNYRQAKTRIGVVQKNAVQFNLPVFYCNCAGAQTELIFDGGSLVVSSDGTIVDEMPYFEEGIRFYEFEHAKIKCCDNSVGANHIQDKNEIKLIHDALI